MTHISVIVPVFDAERYLSSCLDGLLSQSVPRCRYDINVVDNNSSDGSIEVARRYGDEITLLHQPIQGSYAARNMGIRHARGEIIATIDPDCRPEPDWLASVAEAMSDPSCGIALGRRRYGEGEALAPLSLLCAYECEKIAYITERGLRELYYGYTNNMAVRRDVFDRIGLFPERMRGGDTIFVRRAVDALGCDLVRYVPAMQVRHLEIASIGDYYRKRSIYGTSNERITRAIKFRPLRNWERWEIFTRLVRSYDLSLTRALMLLGLLIPAALLYEWGRRRAA